MTFRSRVVIFAMTRKLIDQSVRACQDDDRYAESSGCSMQRSDVFAPPVTALVAPTILSF